MLKITETPHRGAARTWTASDNADFCIKVQRANPRGGWMPEWTFDQFRAYLANDLRALDIAISDANE